MNEDIVNGITIELLNSLQRGHLESIPTILNKYEEQDRIAAMSFFIGCLRFLRRQDVLSYIKTHLRPMYIDAEIFKCNNSPNYRRLDLSGLELTNRDLMRLMPQILSTEGLEYLDLSNNDLTRLPNQISQLNTLRNLHVAHNDISSIPLVILRMNGLYLDIIGSRASSIEIERRDRLSILEPESPERVIEMEQGIKALENKSGFRDGYTPFNILNGKEVADQFLAKLSANYKDRDITTYYHIAAKHLLKQVLSKDLQLSNAALIAMASALGDCKNPVHDLLEKTAIGILKDSGADIPLSLETAIHRQAFEELIRKKRIPLSNLDPTEARSGFTNTLFLEGAEEHLDNPLQIVGERQRIPSKTEDRYIGFAFKEITKEAKEKFAKLICKTDNEGNLIVNSQGKYILDAAKYLVITESYMKGLGILSKREVTISNKITELKAMIPKSFFSEHFSDSDVSKLIDFTSQEKNLRETLAQVPDSLINSTARKFLSDYRNDIKRASQRLEPQLLNLQELANMPKNTLQDKNPLKNHKSSMYRKPSSMMRRKSFP